MPALIRVWADRSAWCNWQHLWFGSDSSGSSPGGEARRAARLAGTQTRFGLTLTPEETHDKQRFRRPGSGGRREGHPDAVRRRRCCTLGGRSMLSHALQSPAEVAPDHLVAVLGRDREQPPRWSLTSPAISAAGSKSPSRRSNSAPATRPCAGCRLCPRGSTASWSSPPATSPARRHHPADLDRRPPCRIGRGDHVDHHGAPGPRLRPHPAHPGRRGHRDVEEADATRSSGHPGGQRRHLRLRHRVGAVFTPWGRLSSDNAQHEFSTTDAIAIVRADGHPARQHIDDAALVAGVKRSCATG